MSDESLAARLKDFDGLEDDQEAEGSRRLSSRRLSEDPPVRIVDAASGADSSQCVVGLAAVGSIDDARQVDIRPGHSNGSPSQGRRLTAQGQRESEWDRNSGDNDFEFDKAVLTRQSSVRKNADGSFVIDESVPPAVAAMLRQLEREKAGPQNVRKEFSMRKAESGLIEVVGDAPEAIHEQVAALNSNAPLEA